MTSALSGKFGIWVVREETAGRVVVDERTFGEPFDSSALRAGIAEGVPHRQQVRVLIVQFSLESAEGASTIDGARQPAPGTFVADLLGEVGHVLVPDVGRHWIDTDEVQLVEVHGVLPVDARVRGPERDLARSRVDQPPVFIIGSVGQRGGDLVQVKPAQVQHPARLVRTDRQCSHETNPSDQRLGEHAGGVPACTGARHTNLRDGRASV
jgi:hypothetical protein